MQSQVSLYLNNGRKKQSDEKKTVPEVKSIKVPIPTFPPTAMVYSVPKSPNSSIKNGETENDNQQPVDIVSAAIMAKVLEERERERSMIKHCDSCTCANKTIKIVSENAHHSVAVQTNDNLSDNSASSSLINLSEISHHRLCDKSSPSFDISAKDNLSIKGPRYCSMRLQTGSKNILLDNAHSNVAPVLYTRQSSQKNKKEDAIRAHSCSSDDDSLKNQQRIADWVENSNDFEVSSPEKSKSESLKNNNNNEKLAVMEDNVKKFLFGKSEFLKTVEIGKIKYQNLRDGASVHNQNYSKTSRSNSHTETEI